MTGMIPTFAVVGHPNKGKSSIVATLAEDERVAISNTPGTTRAAHRHTFSIDGIPQYVLVDTPGFQRPGELLDWLRARAESPSDRPRVVADFVAAHGDDPRFRDECELLRPLIEGAGILYVVDGAKPYGPEYELEMEVLQWTGRPRMALINLIGAGDYRQEWQLALGQFFSIVRVFDAMHADFDKRVSLLRAFGELDQGWQGQLDAAVTALQAERVRRRQRSAREIADGLVDILTSSERTQLKDEDDEAAQRSRLRTRLQQRIRDREELALARVQRIYRHESLERQMTGAEALDSDLFTRQNWELFGLSRTQLVITGALSGAAAGGGIDLLLGGASLLLGTGIGALLGGTSALFGGDELAKVKVLGTPMGGRVLQVGPVAAKNFPWVLLGRAWLHHHLVAERNHAYRAAVVIAVSAEQNLMDAVDEVLRKRLADAFRQVAEANLQHAGYERLVDEIASLLAIRPVQVT